MTVTLTETYKEFLQSDTVEYIDELLEENYELTSILEFIDDHNEEAFVEYYVRYVEAGETNGYNVTDAFVSKFGIEDVAYVGEALMGGYRSEAEFAEEFYNEQYDIPCELVVNWQQTWERSLSYDYDAVDSNGGVHIFRRYY